MERKFTIVTGHGKVEFLKKDDGTLIFKSVNDRPLSESEIGKLGVRKDEEKDSR